MQADDLSKFNFLLEQELPDQDASSARAITSGGNGECSNKNSSSPSRDIHYLNAAKLSLLLVNTINSISSSHHHLYLSKGSVANLSSTKSDQGPLNGEKAAGGSDTSSALQNPRHLSLDEFRVKLKQHNLPEQHISSEQNVSTESTDTGLILLEVEFTPRETDSSEDNTLESRKDETLMQNTARLLHTIFSTNKGSNSSLLYEPSLSSQSGQNSSASSTIETSSGGDDNDDEIDNSARQRQKSQRRIVSATSSVDLHESSSSLFLTLIEKDAQQHPVSVCRLISDMMMMQSKADGTKEQDEGLDISDKHHSHVLSFKDVMDDLEQMIMNPEKFLYDQGTEFSSTNSLHFGQGYYGRTKELKKFIEVSTRNHQDSKCHNGDIVDKENGGNVTAILVSGAAGSGKSHFVRYATDKVLHGSNVSASNKGSKSTSWILLDAKFKRSSVYESRKILSSLFGKLITNLVAMRKEEDNEETASGCTNEKSNQKNDNGGTCDILQHDIDACYSQRATAAISSALDPASLASLAIFIPSLRKLIPKIVDKSAPSLPVAEADMSHWQLVFLLSKLLGSVLGLERRIMICADDLQW